MSITDAEDDGEVVEDEAPQEVRGQALAVRPDTVAAISPGAAFMPAPWKDLEHAAGLIASAPGFNIKLREPAAAMFVAYQAARFGADPIALASKVYFTTSKVKVDGGDGRLIEVAQDRVGYEAQWIMALIEADPLLMEPLEFRYGYSDPSKRSAMYRFVEVSGMLRAKSGRIVRRSVTTPTVAQIKIRNSPLWYSDPDQQLAYYGGRLWGRRHRPGRLLGIYAPDEVASMIGHNSRGALADDPLSDDDDAEADFGEAPEPTADDAKHFERWHAKASGEQDSRDPRDAAPKTGASAEQRRRDPAPPPASDGNAPGDLAEIKAWAESERARIVAITPPLGATPKELNETIDAVVNAGNAFVADPQTKRLKAYEPAEFRRIDQSIRRHLENLKAG